MRTYLPEDFWQAFLAGEITTSMTLLARVDWSDQEDAEKIGVSCPALIWLCGHWSSEGHVPDLTYYYQAGCANLTNYRIMVGPVAGSSSALGGAALHGCVPVMRLVYRGLPEGSRERQTALNCSLQLAAENGRTRVLRLLKKWGADPDYVDEHRASPECRALLGQWQT